MSESNAVLAFLPSTHGLHFPNRFPHGPTVKLGPIDPRWIGVGDAAAGLCGGMSWLVRERFEAGAPIPADTEPPANGSALFRTIVRRQVLSLDWMRGPLQFWLAAGKGPKPLAKRTQETEWPKVKSAIDSGVLPLVGLVRHTGWNPFALTKDHQVLAFGYSTDGPTGSTTIRLYDPNWPDRDDVTITLDAFGLRQNSGEPLFGFFVQD